MSVSPAIARLAAWPELWRYPQLFACVHGAEPDAHDAHALVAAMLAEEVEDPAAAWRSILDQDDLAAAQVAYDQLAPVLGIDIARKDLDRVRASFVRRVGAVRDRARALTAGRLRIEAVLEDALQTLMTRPRAAERQLAAAFSDVEASEYIQLEHLRRIHVSGGGERRHYQALEDAISSGDLRRALIFASRLDAAVTPVQPRVQDIRLEREPTDRIVEWRLNQDLAPAWFPRITLADHDITMLSRLDALCRADQIGVVDANHFSRVILRFLMCGEEWDGDLSRGRSLTDDTWTITLRGPATTKLFPHVVNAAGEAELVFPKSPAARFPAAHAAGPFIGWDMFESWRLRSRPDAIIATPRMLLELLELQTRRGPMFARLQSRQVAVRPLILHVLGRDLDRCLGLAQLPMSRHTELTAGQVLMPLLEALDVYVDEGDVLAIRDACGDRIEWLLLVLHVAARGMESAVPANRRFDALSLLRRPTVERELEAALEADLGVLLEDRVRTSIVLDTADDVFETGGSGKGGVEQSVLATALVREEYAGSVAEADAEIASLISLGLLRRAPVATGMGSTSNLIHPHLPLPARVLLGR